jgi:hypothetical protein
VSNHNVVRRPIDVLHELYQLYLSVLKHAPVAIAKLDAPWRITALTWHRGEPYGPAHHDDLKAPVRAGEGRVRLELPVAATVETGSNDESYAKSNNEEPSTSMRCLDQHCGA